MTPLSRGVIGSLLILAWPTAHAADGQKIFTQGGANPAAMACLGCHGPDGKGIAAAGFPRLAGLPAGYLSKQLHDWRDGTRKQPVMEPLAKALSASATAGSTAPAGYDPRFINYANFLDARTPTSQAPYKPYAALQNQDFTGWGIHGNITVDLNDSTQSDGA